MEKPPLKDRKRGVPPKVKHRILTGADDNPALKIRCKRVLGSTVRNSRSGRDPGVHHRSMGTPTAVYPHGGIFLGLKEGGASGTRYRVNEP